MCDVCRLEGKDWKFLNHPHTSLVNSKFYRVYMGQVARVQLCYLHSVEHFLIGETRFLRDHFRLAVDMGRNRALYTKGSDAGTYNPASSWF